MYFQIAFQNALMMHENATSIGISFMLTFYQEHVGFGSYIEMINSTALEPLGGAKNTNMYTLIVPTFLTSLYLNTLRNFPLSDNFEP